MSYEGYGRQLALHRYVASLHNSSHRNSSVPCLPSDFSFLPIDASKPLVAVENIEDMRVADGTEGCRGASNGSFGLCRKVKQCT